MERFLRFQAEISCEANKKTYNFVSNEVKIKIRDGEEQKKRKIKVIPLEDFCKEKFCEKCCPYFNSCCCKTTCRCKKTSSTTCSNICSNFCRCKKTCSNSCYCKNSSSTSCPFNVLLGMIILK